MLQITVLTHYLGSTHSTWTKERLFHTHHQVSLFQCTVIHHTEYYDTRSFAYLMLMWCLFTVMSTCNWILINYTRNGLLVETFFFLKFLCQWWHQSQSRCVSSAQRCLSFPERPLTNPISVNAVNVLVAVEGCLWLSSIKLFSSRVKYAPLCVETHASFVDTINLSVLLSRCSQSASSWCQMNASTCDHRSFHSMATKPAEMCCFKKIKSFSTFFGHQRN